MIRWRASWPQAEEHQPNGRQYVDLEDSAGLRAQHLGDAAKCVVRAYEAWCAGSRRDRSRLYGAFCDALRREERAARQVELDSRGADPLSRE
jgi:hypothetical protein